jgi:group I intron endonuclease
MSKGIIYIHKNKLTGKVYIGQTWKNPERRWGKGEKSFSSYRNVTLLYEALLEHGWEVFESSVLDEATTQKELNQKEQYYIDFYKSLAPEGYNTRWFCQGREKHSDSTKDKIRKKATGRKRLAASWNRKPNIIIEGIEHRHCKKCDTHKPLTSYLKINRLDHNGERQFDTYCKDCKNLYKRTHFGYKRKTKKEIEQSLKNRGRKHSELYKTPEYQEFYRKLHSKSLLQIDPTTGLIVKEYECQGDVKKDGFFPSRVSTAKKEGKTYRGFLWKNKDE